MADDRLSKLRLLESVTFDSINAASEDKRAPLIGQMRAILAEIAELEGKAQKAGDPLDEIAARRVARGGATARTRSTERRPS